MKVRSLFPDSQATPQFVIKGPFFVVKEKKKKPQCSQTLTEPCKITNTEVKVQEWISVLTRQLIEYS